MFEHPLSPRPSPALAAAIITWSCATLLGSICLAGSVQAGELPSGLLRYPDVSATQVVFVYNNDVWIAPKTGGAALPLSSPPGEERFPRFSPDGTKVAYSASYDGNLDVYELAVSGGEPRRLSVQPYGARICDYTPDGRVVFAAWDAQTLSETTLWYADPKGGLPTRLPVKYGDMPSFSSDGAWIAFTPYRHVWQDESWHGYRGGQAADVWTFNFGTHESKQVTSWEGTDDSPMVCGERIFYLSDAGPEKRRNIWVYDTSSAAHSQVTHFAESETRWPSAGPQDLVFQNAGQLWLLPLDTLEPTALHISIAGDSPNVRPRTLLLEGPPESATISPQAKRLAIEKRGDIWTIPAKQGVALNLTPTDGSAEREPAWSPDGKDIAYISDASGSYEVYVRAADGKTDPRQLTHDSPRRMQQLHWSPDSKRIAFVDRGASYYVVDVASGKVECFATDAYNSFGPWTITWSPDSRWISYSICDERSTNQVVHVYDVDTKLNQPVTSPAFDCFSPCFDAGGEFLYYITRQGLSPSFSDVDDWDAFNFQDSSILAALPLRQDVPSPFIAKSDEEGEDDAEAANGAGSGSDEESSHQDDESGKAADGAGDEDAPEPVEIDFEGIAARGIALPLDAGNYFELTAGSSILYYLSADVDYSSESAGSELHSFDLAVAAEADPAAPPDSVLAAGISEYALTPDAASILVRDASGQLSIMRAGESPMPPSMDSPPGMDSAGEPVPLPPLRKELNPRNEWRQMINENYCTFKDEFYDPGMHGVDWEAARDRALSLLPYACCTEDVAYIISEMNGELSVGHAYVMPAQSAPSQHYGLGMLGCDFEQATDAQGNAGIRISHIYRGADWELDASGPLSEPGVNARVGEFLLAVNGVQVDADTNPYALLVAQAGQTLRLTLGSTALHDATARDVLVRALPGDVELRHRDWVEANRRRVYEASGGRVGYIHVRDTWVPGLIDLERQFLGQHNMEALIIDDRYNAGGFVPQRFIEMLDRPLRMYDAMQAGANWRTPRRAHLGPKVMIINQYAGSGGDGFPWLFRQSGLGKLVGTRTWGGFVGIWGAHVLLDGTAVSVPASGSFDAEGNWIIEGYGVAPDILAVNDPSSLAAGRDAQLETAISEALAQADAHPQAPVAEPPYPRPGAH